MLRTTDKQNAFRFDSNYHYVVPEFSDKTDLKLKYNKALNEYKEAKEAGINARPVILGPLSFLILGKKSRSAEADFEPISLLSKLLPIYEQLLSELKEAGAEWVQIDEPILVLDVASKHAAHFEEAYTKLAAVAPKIMLTTYFGRLESNVEIVAKLPVAGLHIDLDREPGQLAAVANAIKGTKLVLSLGLVSGRNIWKNDLTNSVKLAREACDILGDDRIIVATSSSLLHTPVTLQSETKLTPEQKDWFSFALEKAAEVSIIAQTVSGSQDPQVAQALEANVESIKKRRDFEHNSDDAVRKRVANIQPKDLERQNPFPVRAEAQKALNLPKFPTTTIGSFPVCGPMSRYTSIEISVLSKPRKFARLVPSLARANLLRTSTMISSRKKSTLLSNSRRSAALTSWSTASPRGTTWFNTSASD